MSAPPVAGDLSFAVLAGNLGAVEGLLSSEAWRRQCGLEQLDEALELAALLGSSRLPMLKLLLQHGARPLARGAAAWAWAEQRKGEPDVLRALQEAVESQYEGERDVLRALQEARSDSESQPVGNLAVAAWCMGLQEELSGLRASDSPQPRLKSLQQYLADAGGPVTVADLKRRLQRDWPELFCGRGSAGDFGDQDRLESVGC